MNKLKLIKRFIINKLFSTIISTKVRHYEVSILASVDDELQRPNDSLLDISSKAINFARKLDLKEIQKKIHHLPKYYKIWPGEHYKLLAGFILALNPKLVIEIGTAEGLSALTMKQYLSKDSKIITFDIIPWHQIANTFLKKEDFNNHFVQYTDDLSKIKNTLKYKNILNKADLIFIDAAKDETMEYKFLENFNKIGLKNGAIIIFDDIKILNMFNFWRQIKYPKLDLTSFGHWTGTGVIEYKNN